MRSFAFRSTSYALCGIFLMVSSCATNPVTGKKDFVLISEEQEIQMGREADPVIVAQFGLYPNQELQNFINAKGQAMARISHRPNLNYEFRILDSPVVNAFAVPGGYVYFTRGILAHFNNEAEFAGVLGHEIGHITARHSVRAQSRQLLFQVGLIAGVVIEPDLAQFADLGQQAIGLLLLKYSRDHESESDALGVEYSTKISYDAHEMADFFQTLKRLSGEGGETLPTFLSTHPDPADRYDRVHKLATEAQKGINRGSLEVNRNAYLKMIDGIVYGEDPRQGFFEDQMFYHPELKFQFPVPSNWITQNSPQDVRMAPQNGKALMIFAFAPGNTLDEAAQAFVQENQLQVVDSRRATVNGFPTMIVLADQVNAQNPQQVIRILTYFIQDGKNIFKFHGLAMSNDYASFAALFANSMEGYRRLTDQSKINRQPERIKVVSVPRTGSLQSVLQSMNIPSGRLNEFAVLNGMQLDEQVEAGTLIKVLQ